MIQLGNMNRLLAGGLVLDELLPFGKDELNFTQFCDRWR